MAINYSEIDIPVAGGNLHVGVWEPAAGYTDTVIAVHGVTSSHKAWPLVAKNLPHTRVIAPDLRGRGRSNALPEPYGMTQHSQDLIDLLDFFSIEKATSAGHSMGAFVSVITAYLFPDRVQNLVLVDGGIPLYSPENLSGEDLLKAVVGPAVERLAMKFNSVEDYLTFWQAHPAFKDDFTETITNYVKYDLDQLSEDQYQASTNYKAMAADSKDLHASDLLMTALATIDVPTVFMRAEFGLLGTNEPLYTHEYAVQQISQLPSFELVEIPELNHYTIVMAEAGAKLVAAQIEAALALQTHSVKKG